ncbi:unnamed protein product [Paramecium octaurelia]|uniref:Transmembrane protein n=1 Tax=Paramecium octaurelia TaxID=43137 RepID=A0A8S1S960_PAROT|nr:unnamed protein product [Paramecium octaurelia]
MKLKGEEVKCNSSTFGDEIECSSYTQNFVIGDGNLMDSDFIFNNVFQEEQTEQMLSVSMDQEEILGWDNREDDSFQRNSRIHSNIKEITNQILLQILFRSQTKIQNQPIVNLNEKATYVDSRDPYILLPDENYKQSITYFSKFQVAEESHSLFVMNQSLKLPDIEFIFDDDDEQIIIEPEASILKLSNDTQISRFNRSQLNRIELGQPFLAQKLMTIDQNTEKFYFSDFNCQDQFEQIKLELSYFKQILLPTSLICLVFYWILTQKAKIYEQSKADEGYELTKLKQEIVDEEEI